MKKENEMSSESSLRFARVSFGLQRGVAMESFTALIVEEKSIGKFSEYKLSMLPLAKKQSSYLLVFDTEDKVWEFCICSRPKNSARKCFSVTVELS